MSEFHRNLLVWNDWDTVSCLICLLGITRLWQVEGWLLAAPISISSAKLLFACVHLWCTGPISPSLTYPQYIILKCQKLKYMCQLEYNISSGVCGKMLLKPPTGISHRGRSPHWGGGGNISYDRWTEFHYFVFTWKVTFWWDGDVCYVPLKMDQFT